MLKFLLLLPVLALVITAPVAAETPILAYAPASPVLVGLGSGQVVLADVDGNKNVDLLTRHPLYGMVRVQYGDGKGNFTPAPTLPLMFPYSISDIRVADFNKDGFADLAALRSNIESVVVLLGNGRGGWSASLGSPFATNTAPLDRTKPEMSLLDVNKDGNVDLIPTNRRRNTFVPLLGDGRGGFTAAAVATLPANENFYSTRFGDVDGDGWIDAISALEGSATTAARLVMQRGDGKGGFGEPTPVAMPLLAAPRVGAVEDVNGDARVDLVLTHETNHVTVLLNQGGGKFAQAVGSPFWVQHTAWEVAVADVNADARADLLMTLVDGRNAPYPGWLAVQLGDGNTFLPAPGSPFRTANGAYNFGIGDVNGDGRVDAATSSFEGVGVTLLLGTGD